MAEQVRYNHPRVRVPDCRFGRGNRNAALDCRWTCRHYISVRQRSRESHRVRGGCVNFVIIGVVLVGPLFSPVLEGVHLQGGFDVFSDEGHWHVARSVQIGEAALILLLTWLRSLQIWSITLLFGLHFLFWLLILAGVDAWQRFEMVVEYLILPFVVSLLWSARGGAAQRYSWR